MGTRVRRWPAPALVAMLVFCAAGSLAAQRIEVRAVNVNGPLAGAMVIVEDAAGGVVTRVLANAAGLGRADVPPGRYRVRVLAIGHAPEVSGPLDLGPGQLASVRLTLVPRPIVIDEIVVSARPACGRDVATGAQLARLWDEARKNLEAAALARAASGGGFEVTTFERDVNPAGVVIRENRRVRRGNAAQPFVAAAAAIETGGYVHRSGGDDTYYAPDEPMLLSDHFLATHCFSVVDGGLDSDLIGLRFEPAPGHRLPDIAGAMWLRRRNAELTLLEYAYANVRLPEAARRVGGQIRFARLPSGSSVIAEWIIRMPRIVTIEARRRSRDSLAGYHEVGGITNLDRRPLDGRAAVVTGRVVDSITGTGLGGVAVSVSDGAYAGVTNEAGAFQVSVPLQGHFLVTFEHPRIELLRLAPLQRAVTLVRGEASPLLVRLPGVRTVLDRLCPTDSVAADRGVVVGRVLDASGGRRAGVEVVATWSRVSVAGRLINSRPVELTVTTTEGGAFAVCAPLGHTVTLRAPMVDAIPVELSYRRDPVAFATLTGRR